MIVKSYNNYVTINGWENIIGAIGTKIDEGVNTIDGSFVTCDINDSVPFVRIGTIDENENKNYIVQIVLNNSWYDIADISFTNQGYCDHFNSGKKIEKKEYENKESLIQKIANSESFHQLWRSVENLNPDAFHRILSENNIVNLKQYLEGFGIDLDSNPQELINPDTLELEQCDRDK